MGNSLDYIKYRVLERKDTNLDIAFDNVFEISPKKFLKLDEHNQVSIVLKALENISDTPEGDITVQIAYNQNADFSYFTTSSSIHSELILVAVLVPVMVPVTAVVSATVLVVVPAPVTVTVKVTVSVIVTVQI